MRGFGDHLQYSVFRCALTERERLRLTTLLTQVINDDEDQVLFVDLGAFDSTSQERYATLGRIMLHPRRHVIVV